MELDGVVAVIGSSCFVLQYWCTLDLTITPGVLGMICWLLLQDFFLRYEINVRICEVQEQ